MSGIITTIVEDGKAKRQLTAKTEDQLLEAGKLFQHLAIALPPEEAKFAKDGVAAVTALNQAFAPAKRKAAKS